MYPVGAKYRMEESRMIFHECCHWRSRFGYNLVTRCAVIMIEIRYIRAVWQEMFNNEKNWPHWVIFKKRRAISFVIAQILSFSSVSTD